VNIENGRGEAYGRTENACERIINSGARKKNDGIEAF